MKKALNVAAWCAVAGGGLLILSAVAVTVGGFYALQRLADKHG